MINIKKIAILLFAIIIVFLGSCKKDTDTVSSQNIHGQVYNLCTDIGIANVTVYLQQNGSNIAQTNSGTNGNFNFNNVQIHSSSDYGYSLYIKSTSGIGGGDIGFDGVDENIDKNNLNQTFILNVVPHFADLHFLIYPSVHITYPDTITVFFQQNIFHKNLPNLPYSLGFATPDVQPGYPHYSSYTIGNYPMGWWHVTINKTKSGVNTIVNDSVYVDWGATVTDTIPW